MVPSQSMVTWELKRVWVLDMRSERPRLMATFARRQADWMGERSGLLGSTTTLSSAYFAKAETCLRGG